MPVSFYNLIEDTASVKLNVNTGKQSYELNVEYHPERITEETFAHLQNLEQMQTTEEGIMAGFRSVNDLLIDLVASWDLYQDQEQTIPYPLEANELKKLPWNFRVGVLMGIMKDLRPEALAALTTS